MRFGGELIGAKQNRIANASFLVPAESELVIDVSCVEAGRWGRRRRERFSSGETILSSKLRRTMSRRVHAARVAGAGFQAPPADSPGDGGSVDWSFFGYVVHTGPSATLTGTRRLATMDGGNDNRPVDGSKGENGFAIAYEEHVSGLGDKVLKGFVVIPTPGAMGLLGFAGLAAIRRRR